MKLVISIVSNEAARPLINSLMRRGHRATMVSTTGGFLREGNATIFIGTEDKTLEEVLGVIRDNCHTHTQYVNPLPPVIEPGEMYLPTPVEVEVGGATVFVINVDRFEKY
jgi:uncharacterized protein YaaQ